jgi:uncharacterized protein (TIGR02145 family)
VLENALGGSAVAGTALKASFPVWDGTDSSGFSALPCGYKDGVNGYFEGQGNYGGWWSSSPDGLAAWRPYLLSGNSTFNLSIANSLGDGFSVRCVRD